MPALLLGLLRALLLTKVALGADLSVDSVTLPLVGGGALLAGDILKHSGVKDDPGKPLDIRHTLHSCLGTLEHCLSLTTLHCFLGMLSQTSSCTVSHFLSVTTSHWASVSEVQIFSMTGAHFCSNLV